jgi:propionyl-CoA carboxylase alpha chain
MFKKILIANRGEIACRVIKTARKMGIATVAVYSEADAMRATWNGRRGRVHRRRAQPRELPAADKIIAGLQGHRRRGRAPGLRLPVGERGLRAPLEEEGIVFIGPKHYSIAAMGDKIASKKLAWRSRVNTIPGWNDGHRIAEQAVEIARDIGYPVMIKASAGGGGKGLRVAFERQGGLRGLHACRNEARNSFGDDRVFIEKFVESPRHIEIQVLGDAHGNVVYLHERECSIQRRHQKVIEEAPSPFISEATRRPWASRPWRWPRP